MICDLVERKDILNKTQFINLDGEVVGVVTCKDIINIDNVSRETLLKAYVQAYEQAYDQALAEKGE